MGCCVSEFIVTPNNHYGVPRQARRDVDRGSCFGVEHVGAAWQIGAESLTASLYTALRDECEWLSGPRYKSRTVSSFVERH